MTKHAPVEITEFREDLEDLWRHQDDLFEKLTPTDWDRKHGKDWIFSDVPYHLAYFDREIVARPIEQGEDVPPEERKVIRSMNELRAWNAAHFARRPVDQTVDQSLRQMRESRERVRRAIANLTDADLDRPAFMPLMVGWVKVRDILTAGITHNFSEATQLRLRMGRAEPKEPARATHRALGFYVNFMTMTLNRELARSTPFTVVMAFSGPGGGAWTIQVANGACEVREGHADRADLEMIQSPETFVKSLNNMHNPMVAMLTGKIKVKGVSKMGTFGKLFPEPKPDAQLGPEPAVRPAMGD